MDKNNLLFNSSTLTEKNNRIEQARIALKKEFVGIDDQIDIVIDNVRSWYLFPELQERPVIINLFGMTGCGKTSLINRLAELLDEDNNMVYWNFAEFGGLSSNEIEDNIEYEVSNDVRNRIIVFDEFQYAASVTTDGAEKDTKSSFKPFWELVDTGIIRKRYSVYDTTHVSTLLNDLRRINGNVKMEIKEGVWTNTEACLKPFNSNTITEITSCLKVGSDKNDEDGEHRLPRRTYYDVDSDPQQSVPDNFFINAYYWAKILSIYTKSIEPIPDYVEFWNKVKNYDIDEWISFVENVHRASQKGYEINFQNSIIFVCMNVDELYTMAFNVDVDMSPDTFHEMSKKFTTVEAKEALQKRFRNEQIARLGNTMVIYPSFSSESFRNIIKLALNNYSKSIADKINMNIEYDDAILQLIYDESVFPTQGTRPIFSSIHELIKSKLPQLVLHVSDNKIDADTAVYMYNSKTKEISIEFHKDGSIIENDDISRLNFPPEKLRVIPNRESDESERQAMTAIHEAGHFVMYVKHHGNLPEKVMSRTVSSDTQGFLLTDIKDLDKTHTAKDIRNEIEICLGGYVAETMFFGDMGGTGVTTGSSEDLKLATSLASQYFRNWGMCGTPTVTTYLTNGVSTLDGTLVNYSSNDARSNNINTSIEGLITRSMDNVTNTLKNPIWRGLYVDAVKYLSKNSILTKDKMEEFVNKIPEVVRKNGVRNDRYFRDIVDNL